jgi:hypothetical protein
MRTTIMHVYALIYELFESLDVEYETLGWLSERASDRFLSRVSVYLSVRKWVPYLVWELNITPRVIKSVSIDLLPTKVGRLHSSSELHRFSG